MKNFCFVFIQFQIISSGPCCDVNNILFQFWFESGMISVFQKTKQNKTKLDMLPSQDGVPCRLWDIETWLTPVSLFIPQMWCKGMKYMNIISNIKEVMNF